MRLDGLVVRGRPDDVALIHGERQLRYAELDRLISHVAGGLAAAGLKPGDRSAVYLGKSIETVTALFAIARAGGVFVPVNPALKPAQVAHIVTDSGARLLITGRTRAQQLAAAEVTIDARVLTVEDDWERLAGTPAIAPVDVGADALAAILYTSGSTGKPKGVMLSHRNLCLGADAVATYLSNRPDDRILSVLPLSFDYGLNQVTTAFYAGAAAVLLDFLTPRDVVRAVERHRVTGLAGVPPLWIQLAEASWPEDAARSLRYITNSGGRMPVALTRRLQALLPEARIFLMYGLTEAFRSTYLDPALVDTRPESIGKAIPHAEVLVVRPDGSETAPDEPGELVHVGPLVAQGYWQDPERTTERFRPAPPSATMGSIAVYSGDTVRRDAEGFLYFVGRTDEMIKTSGNRVSPTEIEEAAYATGVVGEAAAFGVPDERLGQTVLLFATPAAGLTPGAAEARLRSAMAAAVPAYMVPKQIVWRAELPRNANGKLDRTSLRAELEA